MPRQVNHRSVTPIVDLVRSFARGKKFKTNPLRYEDLLASRTQPPPHVPGGPYHKTSKIYYYTRDGRREVQPPMEISVSKQIESGKETVKDPKQLTPGPVYLK